MTTSHFATIRQVQRQLLLVLAASTLFTAGCSSMNSTASSSGAVSQAVTLSGRVHGGNQPVSGATVTLYFAGSTFASGATVAATTTSANDGYGSFSFIRGADGTTGTGNTFSCPSNPPAPVAQNGGPYMFVVARGGNTVNDGSTSVNNDSVFIAPFGRCGGINTSTFVNMSEVVTAATVAAVHQYMDPSVSPIESSIGADGIYVSDLALSQSFATVSNMVDLSTGLAVASTAHTSSGNGVTGVTLTSTPEQAKINHVADILSSCINNAASGSAACSTLYNAAAPSSDPSTTSVPATGGRAADVLMAAYYIFTNPTNGSTSNLATLYGIPAATGSPYLPRLTAPPSDWTIGIDYTSTGSCSDVTTPSANFLNRAVDLVVDLNSNIWFANNQSGAGSLAGIGPTGTPQACFTLPAGTANVGTGNGSGAQSTAIDVAGRVWVGSSRSNDIYRYSFGGVGGTSTTITATTTSPVLAITADGYGDVFYSTTNGNLYELVNAANVPTVPAAVQIATSLGIPTHIMIDTNNTIWVASQSGFVTAVTGSVQNTSPASLGAFTSTTYNFGTVNFAVSATRSYGSNETGGPGVYVSDIAGTASYLLSSGTVGSPFSGGGVSSPAGIAVDGAQNVWLANTTGTGPSEFSKAGVALSPAVTGFTKTATVGGFRSVVIDASGNVWLGREGLNTITEIVGGAVPVFQPYAAGLAPATAIRFQRIP